MKISLTNKLIFLIFIFLNLTNIKSVIAHDYEVTVTNITQRQVFTPILSFIHIPEIKAVTLGQPVIPQVAAIAESGNVGPALEAIASLPEIIGSASDTGAPLSPGESITIEIDAIQGMNNISMLAMLIPTNDAFFILNGQPLPNNIGETLTYRLAAYDAGSEMNDELCSHIPGPSDVCSGEGNSAEDGEGYVHIHPGIHGIGDLPAERYDWRNPVVLISITRVADES